GTDQPAISADGLYAVVARAGLARQAQGHASSLYKNAAQAPSSALLHHALQCRAQGRRHFTWHDPFAAIGADAQSRFIGCIAGEMQAVDTDAGQPNAIVDDDAHQLRQGRRTITGAAQSGGQRWHQMFEGIAQSLPTTVDIGKGFDLQHDADAAVASALVATAEQPAIDFLPLFGAGGDGLENSCIGVADQVAKQP